MAEKVKFSWKIWLKKFGLNVALTLIVGVASVYAENPYVMAFIPLLKGLENYIKHNTNFKII